MDFDSDLRFGGTQQKEGGHPIHVPGQEPPMQGLLRREQDSLDDFEHLGHDSSPLHQEPPKSSPSPLADSPRDHLGGINNKGAASGFTDDLLSSSSLSSFDPLSYQQPPRDKMDSNLLQMGDNFPDRHEADAKLDKFLLEMDSTFAPSKPEPPKDWGLSDGFKGASQNFVDFERGSNKPVDELERYSDSDPEIEPDFKPAASTIKHQPDVHFQSDDLPPTKKPVTDHFQDLDDDFHNLQTSKIHDFQPPSKLLQDSPPRSPKVEPVVPEVVKEKTPEPVKKIDEKPIPAKPKSESSISKKIDDPKSKTSKANVVGAEAIFCKMGLVESLIYWRDPKKSGPVFGGVLLVLLALTYFSLISVVAYLSLLALTGTISFRIYKNIIQAVQKTGDGHPFKDLLDFDISLSHDKVREISEVAVAHLNAAVAELRRIFLVEDLVDSIKFGVLLWGLTYVGAWFNGMTLIIIAWVALFTLPKVYETNKTQIDANLEIVRTKLAEITSKVKAAIPIGKKDEKKEE